MSTESVLYFPFGLNYTHISTMTSDGATVSYADGTVCFTTGAAGSVAMVEGCLPIYVNQEPRMHVGMNAAYASPTEGLTQLVGLGSSERGVFIGYNGMDFGILYRHGGKKQHWSLTITSACTTTGYITLTLLGVAHTVPVYAGMTIGTVMYMVKQALATTPCTCFIGNTMDIATTLTGDFAALTTAVDFAATGCAGSISVTTAGVASTDHWVYEADFNSRAYVDVADVSKQDVNVYDYCFSRWSTGAIEFSMTNPVNDCKVVIHTLFPQTIDGGFNTSVPYKPYIFMNNAATCSAVSLKCLMATVSSGTPANVTTSTRFRRTFSVTAASLSAGVGAVIGCMYPDPTKMVTASISEVRINASTSAPLRVQFYANAVLSQIVTTTQHLPWSSVWANAATPTTATSVLGGLLYASSYFGTSTAEEKVLTFQQLWLVPSSSLSVVLLAPTSCTVSVEIDILWTES
jgi:hypothetical protein